MRSVVSGCNGADRGAAVNALQGNARAYARNEGFLDGYHKAERKYLPMVFVLAVLNVIFLLAVIWK